MVGDAVVVVVGQRSSSLFSADQVLDVAGVGDREREGAVGARPALKLGDEAAHRRAQDGSMSSAKETPSSRQRARRARSVISAPTSMPLVSLSSAPLDRSSFVSPSGLSTDSP